MELLLLNISEKILDKPQRDLENFALFLSTELKIIFSDFLLLIFLK